MSETIQELAPYKGKFFEGEWPTITEMFNITLSRFPERTCFTVFEKSKKISFNYTQAHEIIQNVASYLNQKGIKRGDKVVLTGKNSIGWGVSYFAINYAGAVVVPIDAQLPIERMLKLAAFADAKFLITDGDVFAKLPSDTFTFEIIENGLAKIEANNIVYNLNVVDSSEYPQIDLSAIGIKLILSSKDINDAISQVSFAASQKNTRPQLMAVNTESTSSSIIFTATDGARLARKEIAIDTNGVFSVNIPSKTFIEIARTLDDTKEVEVYVSDKKVLFKTDFTTISTSLIEGDYPNVKNIIPKNFYYYLEVNAEEFLNALSRVSLLSIERENVVKMTMEEGRAIISSKSQQCTELRLSLNSADTFKHPLIKKYILTSE